MTVEPQTTLRTTDALRTVLRALLNVGDQETYMYAVCHGTGLASGTVSPILTRLHGLGWISDRWEPPAERPRGQLGAPRRYWRLSETGRVQARLLLDAAAGQLVLLEIDPLTKEVVPL